MRPRRTAGSGGLVAGQDPKWGAGPLLLGGPRGGRAIDPEALLACYEGHVPKWWLPDAVLTVAELPHTATGKLNKLVLRAQYGQHFVKTAAA